MNLKGVVGYVLTPFDEQDRVDHALLAAHIGRLVDLGVHGIAPLGSVGCLQYLDDEERIAVIRSAVAAVRGRVPILAGVSSLSTASTIFHARAAQEAGAAAVQVLPSTYWTLTEDEIFAYYAAVAAAISIPLMVYNNPFTTGLDMSVEFLRRLASIPNIRFIKESSPDKTKIARLRAAVPEDIGIFVGLNAMARQGLADGAAGWCTAAPNVCAPFVLELYRHASSGDQARADMWFARQSRLLGFLMDHGLPRTIASALELCGVSSGALRAPLTALAPARRQELRHILETMEIIR